MTNKNLSILLCLFLAACGSSESQTTQHSYDVLITADPLGWDEYIREIGNVVQKDGTYYLYYSGHRGPNYRGKPDIYVGVASSVDGKAWVKHGIVMSDPAEDPHVLVKDGKCYMVYEEKSEIPDRRTSMAESNDCIKFTRTVFGILDYQPGTWQGSTVSSPAFVSIGSQTAIIYEGTGTTNGVANQGKIGLYINGAQLADPVFEGFGHSWDKFVASDDITFYNGYYWMTYHALNPSNGWTSAIAKSKDLFAWEEIPWGPHFNADTVMFFRHGDCFKFLVSDGAGIVAYYRPDLAYVGIQACSKS